jgi:hypothetical protein
MKLVIPISYLDIHLHRKLGKISQGTYLEY